MNKLQITDKELDSLDDKLYREMLNHFYEGIYFVTPQRQISFWNKGAERITGYSRQEVVERHCYDNILRHVDEEGTELCFQGCPLKKTIEDGQRREALVYLHHKNGYRLAVLIQTFPVKRNGEVIGAVEVFQENAERLSILKDLQELEKLALNDQLTEVPNRRYLESQVKNTWEQFKDLGLIFGIIFIDIDHFKHVNDTYGHSVGDEVLKVLSKSMQSVLRKDDFIGRWGGEEFVVIIGNASPEAMETVSEKIRMIAASTPIPSVDPPVRVTVSLGATILKEGEDWQEVLERADRLMYMSKQAGRNRTTFG
ncbi:MAG: sensor domain-containing diguanylate cyclase [Spirochaetia bacterium]|nr:sensor domain-containing diguanylate cyclase [Spirochaetia bacterium]